jgi:hypothetical protein
MKITCLWSISDASSAPERIGPETASQNPLTGVLASALVLLYYYSVSTCTFVLLKQVNCVGEVLTGGICTFVVVKYR